MMRTFVSYNPADGAIAGEYPNTTATEVCRAFEQAQEAAAGWSARTVAERMATLRRLRDSLAGDADSLAQTVANEIGKPLQEAYGADILPSLSALDWLTKNAPRLLQNRKAAGVKGACMEAQPYGVVGVIGTWNYPMFLNVAPIAWALAVGNAVVWKPSELATESALMLAEHFKRVGLPVVTITGDGGTGRALCRAGCDKIVFTGGVATGRAILAELAQTGTPCVMELSGNDAMIVCDNATIEAAAQSAVWGRCGNAGQSCVAPQRIYVAQGQYDKFLAECRRVIETLQFGTDIGPMRTEGLRCRALELVVEAVAGGARLICGGRRVGPGYGVAPTLLADCSDEMSVMAEDFFGPVLAVCPVANAEEAIVRANRSDMALGASVWTSNLSEGRRIASALQVGMVSINEVLLDVANPALPFGGLRSSGWGRQRGAAGLDEVVQWKAIIAHKSGGNRRHLFPYRAATLPILQGFIRLQAAKGWKAKLDAARTLGQAARRWSKER